MSKRKGVNKKLIMDAVDSALKQPRLAFYSPLAASIFNYWKNTLPRYSISEELAKIVEAEVKRRWPDLCKVAMQLIKKKQASRR